MGMLSDKELAELLPGLAGEQSDAGADPTRLERRVPADRADRAAEEGRGAINALGDEYGQRNGLSRRRFFQTAAGMTTAYLAMNEVYGPLFGVAGRGQKRRSRPGARRRAEGPVHHRRAHAFPARRYAAAGFRAHARGGRQSRLESRAGRQAADARRPQVSPTGSRRSISTATPRWH